MKMIDMQFVEEYANRDWIRTRLDELSQGGDQGFTCQRWLRESLPKRAVFEQLYGDLLEPGGKCVLDIGGGVTSFTRELAARNDYTLVDLMAHDSGMDGAAAAMAGTGRLVTGDWWAFDSPLQFDVVVANDLFPNVDQRLALFIEKWLPRCGQMRLSLTWYDDPRWYVTKRVDGDEIFTVLAWDGERTLSTLLKFRENIIDFRPEFFSSAGKSPYPNGRRVCVIWLEN